MQRKMKLWYIQRKNVKENISEKDQIADLLDKDFKTTRLKLLKKGRH